MNTINQTFAAIKAKRDAVAREKKAKAVAFAQHFTEAGQRGDLIQIIGVACNIPDQSKLGKTLMFNLQRAAGNQLIQYLKAEPDELPCMSIGEIRGIESEARIDLLANTLSFLGKDLRELKPRRAMVHAGSREAALFILTAEAVAMIETHPKDGYKKLDADLAKALNHILDCGLPVGEETLTVYEWDNEPFEQTGVDATHDQTEIDHDEGHTWDDGPTEEGKTYAVPGIHW